jgi:hypothetical protein
LLNFATAAATGVLGFASAAQQAAAATEVVTNSLDQLNIGRACLAAHNVHLSEATMPSTEASRKAIHH